ncbi:MAG: ATP-grasp domain-containing protein [Clostridiales bacterium]|nr:ATP-grasp domain-containing protein [Clostridiales bacterium]
MDYGHLTENLQKLVRCAEENRTNTRLFIIATIKGTECRASDYPLHSVSTSYLSRLELDELVKNFRYYCDYLEIYTDIEAFLRDYCDHRLRVEPTIVFETSARGIGRGKDALLPTLCDIFRLPHLGAEATAGVMCSSKHQWTSILRGNGIPVPGSCVYHRGTWLQAPDEGKKYILKLNYECASIGLSADCVMVNDGTNLSRKAAQLEHDYQQPVIAQEFIEGFEVEVPILVNPAFRVALPPVGLADGTQRYFSNGFFDYDSIYFDNYTSYDFRQVMPETAEKIRCCAQRIIDVLDLSGYMRIDFRVGEDGSFFPFDINNDPDINTSGSFLKSVELLGFNQKELAGILLGNAWFNHSKSEYR